MSDDEGMKISKSRGSKPYKQPKRIGISDEERKRRSDRMKALRERLGMVGNKRPTKTEDKVAKAKVKISKKDLDDIEEEIEETKANLKYLKKNKVSKPTKYAKPTKVVSDSDSEEVDVESDDEPPRKTKAKPVAKPVAKSTKPKPKKSIKIKYYDSSISKEEMEYDAKVLEGLHKQDHAHEEKLEEIKHKPVQAVKDEDSDELEYY